MKRFAMGFVWLLALACLSACTAREASETDLKTYFGLNHDTCCSYNPDEATLLRPMVMAKLAELESQMQQAQAKVHEATPATSQELITSYQQARDAYSAARYAAVAYRLIPAEPSGPGGQDKAGAK